MASREHFSFLPRVFVSKWFHFVGSAHVETSREGSSNVCCLRHDATSISFTSGKRFNFRLPLPVRLATRFSLKAGFH